MADEITKTDTSSGRAANFNGTTLRINDDVSRIEAPVTWKAYLICAFASFGGILFGYDSGYINGTTGSAFFIHLVEGPDATALSTPNSSLIVSILSAGTFFGALIAGDVAERIGRKWTVIMGCLIYTIGVIVQMITGPAVDALSTIVAGRVIAGLGVGFESAIVILYMSEIVSLPKKIRALAGQPCIMANSVNSVQSPFAELSLPATNSASPSAFSSPPSSYTRRRAGMIPAHTVFQSLFSSLGLSFLLGVYPSCQIPHVTLLSVEILQKRPMLSHVFVANPLIQTTSKWSSPRL